MNSLLLNLGSKYTLLLIDKWLNNIKLTNSEILCLDIQLHDSQDKHVLSSQCYRPDERDMVEFVSNLLDIYEYSNRNKYHSHHWGRTASQNVPHITRFHKSVYCVHFEDVLMRARSSHD